MSTYACPKGHASTTDDFCDTCGAKIAGAALPPPTGAASAPSLSPPTGAAPAPGLSAPADAAAAPTAGSCPHCGAPHPGTGRFCEDCGFDHHTGKIPVLTTPPASPAPAAPAAAWTATIAADREYYDANAVEGADFPADPRTRTITLPPPQLRIGRRSTSKGTDPEIDLADDDPGVSHSHALLTFSVDGVWLLSDLGSTNGTYLNDEQKPLTAGQTRPLTNGDRVHVGAWTTITVHAPS
ncbi:FHA domain-containing protein [Pseudosporangium ferrugineum]|uniref:FHA domain-containing protein n=1 Tax=Pseudosporangium ferrugineum TaxID=439699 RepID=A0A2T0SJL8_9ACTN|nr:FHA domain-containing protein [Pseudosporangium ferrugineum]PRY33573.1 FHA domain-containing protein [Pseudosporangium ferrugineum]